MIPHFLSLDQISRLIFRFSLHYFASERFRTTFQFYLVTRLVNSILSKKKRCLPVSEQGNFEEIQV